MSDLSFSFFGPTSLVMAFNQKPYILMLFCFGGNMRERYVPSCILPTYGYMVALQITTVYQRPTKHFVPMSHSNPHHYGPGGND